ncbi:MAG: response regulator [Burkholderiaceae bacterium]
MGDDDLRVVVVDDVKDAADTLAMLLTAAGYSAWTANSGEEAIVLIEERMPRCVILDVDMPGIDGYELVTLLRHRYRHDIVLIAVTGWTDSEARVADTFSVVDHYFQKPVDPKALCALLESLGRDRAASREKR